MNNYRLILYSPSFRGETRLKQSNISGQYCVEFNNQFVFGKLSEVWPVFKLTKGSEVRYLGSNK
jgi:hypothetical protein